MADFTYATPAEFTVEVDGGREYSMPRMDGLSARQLGMLGDLQGTGGFVDQVEATRRFFGELCPGLMEEPFSDYGLLMLFKAWSEASDIRMGESLASPE